MSITTAKLTGRGCVRVSGQDRVAFLQGLATNDVETLGDGEAAFAALLTPQGKILFDFIAVNVGDGLLLDCGAALAATLQKRLSMYKLRAKVEIEDISASTAIAAFWDGGANAGDDDAAQEHAQAFAKEHDGIAYADPRCSGLGWRAISFDPPAANSGFDSDAEYDRHRINLSVPECGKDYGSGEVFPHDACLDLLHGVDFKKGCFVGQEVVSRMQHRGTGRTRVLLVTGVQDLPRDGADIAVDGFTVGSLGSMAGRNGIALMRLDRVREALAAGKTLLLNDVAVEVRVPQWATYSLEPAPASEREPQTSDRP